MKNLNISHSIAIFLFPWSGLQLVILLQVLERTPDGDCQRYAAKQVGFDRFQRATLLDLTLRNGDGDLNL